MIGMRGPLVLLDSASLYFRSFFALPDSLVAPDGTQINAVRGFIDTIARIIEDRRPGRLVACLDADWRPQFRVDLLPSYKAHRVADEDPDAEQVPDALSPQVPIILDVLDAFGIATAEADGFEADDVIGTLTHRETRDAVEVVTGDRDLFQLVRTAPTPASIIYVGRGWNKAELLGPAEVAAKYGVPVDRAGRAYAEMAILRGDPSDGLPGVAGIGEKTAAKLITQFGTLDALRRAAEDIRSDVPKRARASLVAAADYLDVAPIVVNTAEAPVVFSGDDALLAKVADRGKVDALAERWNLRGPADRLVAAIEG